MTRDAIVDEVRAFRDEIAREYDYDIGAIFAALRKMDVTGPGHHVSLAPRTIANQNLDGTSRAADQPAEQTPPGCGRRFSPAGRTPGIGARSPACGIISLGSTT